VGAPFDNGGGAFGIGVINGMAAVDYQASRVYFASRRRVGGSPNTLWALDVSGSGLALAWAIDLGDIDGSPVLRAPRVYVGTTAGVVYSVRASDGADLRSFATNDGAVKGFVFPDRTSNDLFVSTDNRVFGLEDNGSAVVSKWPALTIPGPSIPVFDAAARRVVVGGGDGRLYQLDVSGPTPVVTSVQLGDGLAAVGAPTSTGSSRRSMWAPRPASSMESLCRFRKSTSSSTAEPGSSPCRTSSAGCRSRRRPRRQSGRPGRP